MENYYDEQEIDLIDLLYKVIIHYKKIIIFGVVFALLGASFALYKNNKEEKIVNAIMEDREFALEEYEDDISESDIYNVDLYETTLLNYDKQKDYLANSIKMNIADYNNVHVETAVFKVLGKVNNNDLVDYIDKIIINDKVLNNISDLIGYKNNSAYYNSNYFIRELISVQTNDNTNLMTSEDDVKQIKVIVFSSDEKTSETIINHLIETINNSGEDIYNELKTTIKLLNISDSTDAYNYLQDEKTTYQNNIISLASSIESSAKGFNGIQSRLYAYRNDVEVSKYSGIKSAIKYGIVGGVIGVFVVCAYYGLIYLLNGKIHTKDDVVYSGLKVYETIYTNPNNNKFFKHLFKKEGIDVNSSIDIIKSKITYDKKASGIKNIVLASSLSEISFIEELKNTLNIKESYVNISNDSKIIDNNKANTGIVLVEELENSNTKDLLNIASLKKNYSINVIGVVLIDNE